MLLAAVPNGTGVANRAGSIDPGAAINLGWVADIPDDHGPMCPWPAGPFVFPDLGLKTLTEERVFLIY